MKQKLSYEIIVVVDDSSPDNTLAVAKSLQQVFGEEQFRIVSRPGKLLGLGSAYSAGLKASSGQRIILMDADLSHHPKYIPEMIAVMDYGNHSSSDSATTTTNNNNNNGKMKKPDIVSGTRYRKGGGVGRMGHQTQSHIVRCQLLGILLTSNGSRGPPTLLVRSDCTNDMPF
jgi:dolichol-phosphate mannosyltransferase